MGSNSWAASQVVCRCLLKAQLHPTSLDKLQQARQCPAGPVSPSRQFSSLLAGRLTICTLCNRRRPSGRN